MAVEHLYMMAIVPPAEMAERIDLIRKEFAEAYNCKAGLKPPVHITLYAPYKETSDHESEVREVLARWSSTQESFVLSLKGFDAFKTNGVIFINVVVNDALKQL